VDFTREPIIETIITPKEGCKLVVRSSKNTGQEEYFVDAVEVVSFGQASFFRSLERPKPFLVPVSDYELLEVREARMVLKSVGTDRSIKIGGGRESVSRVIRGNDRENNVEISPVIKAETPLTVLVEASSEVKPEERPAVEKKRDRRRQYRKRRGGQATDKTEGAELIGEQVEDEGNLVPFIEDEVEIIKTGPTQFSSLLQPPPTLISETIGRYRENALFKSAFFLDEEDQYIPHDKVQQLLEDDENEEGEQKHVDDNADYESQTSESLNEESAILMESDHSEHFTYVENESSEVPCEETEKFSEPGDIIELPLAPGSEQIENVDLNQIEPLVEEFRKSLQDKEFVLLQESTASEKIVEEKHNQEDSLDSEITYPGVILDDVIDRDEGNQHEEKKE